MQQKILIVCNPNSGKGISNEVLEKFKSIIKNRGYQVELVLTKGPNHATEIVENASNFDTVFSIGGDGTLNEVVKGNYKRDKKMVVCPIPTGSCNDVASMLGYDKTPFKNLELALDGTVKSLDIATINNEPFTYVAGMGKFMHIPYETARDKKSKIGYLAYAKEGVREFFENTKYYQAQIQADNISLDGKYSVIMVSNSNHIAGIPNFYKNVELDDGKLELLLCKTVNRTDFVINSAKFYSSLPTKNIISLKAKKIKIKLKDLPEKNWCVDGERFTYKSKDYLIQAEKKMDFLVPKEKVHSLFQNKNC